MKLQYLIIFLIMGIFFSESQAMSPRKGGAFRKTYSLEDLWKV